MIELAPSILSADFARLADELARVAGRADAIHVDVMDGHFVPNLTIGPGVVAALGRETSLPLDCHLMIADASRWIGAFVEAGARRISVHAEACPHLHRTLADIAAAGAEASVAINPATPVEAVVEVLPIVDQVLVMSVDPGFSGQRFIPESVGKVRRLAERIAERGARARIQVDGGVGEETIGPLVRAGATRFVAGSAVFGAADPALALERLRRAAESAPSSAGGSEPCDAN